MLKVLTFGVVTTRDKAKARVWWLLNCSALPVMNLRPRHNDTRMELMIERRALRSPTRRS